MPEQVGTTYYTCSQSESLSDYKPSNQKKMNEDSVKSAIILIENKYQLKNYKLLIAKTSDTFMVIAFSIPLFDELKSTKEVYLDTTYKTAKGSFELYGLLAEKDRTGFTLGYLILDIK
ncbi:10555_t:CDS:2 [Racocetra persica]|uniref:10555_t:CDS:1 n=1 Tax=Racocetra persica TaxID=160502 RepID=A0ACA9M3I2_9GLOM|nr:10555_t:CDS:2 [Racocetra persica]